MRISLTLFALVFYNFIFAQCDHSPTIEGDFILCPSEVSQISTQEYDSYQWFKKSYSGTDWELIPDATSQFLDVVQGLDDLYYFKVDATLDGCTEASPEVLIDSWVFSGMVVESTGNYTFEDGFFNVCLGESITFSIGLPYTTNIQWYKDGEPIPGENGMSITLTELDESGVYFVEGAPEECPDYIVNPGVALPVLIVDCSLNTNDVLYSSLVSLYPNPVNDKLIIDNDLNKSIEIQLYDMNGKIILNKKLEKGTNQLDFSDLPKGIYFSKFNNEVISFSKIVIKN